MWVRRVSRNTTALVIILSVWAAAGTGYAVPDGQVTPSPQAGTFWQRLIAQARTIGLPTRFLTLIDPDFVTIEFEDVRNFAAEYHPDQHRMVLNRALSLNSAGGTLRPLSRLAHRDLATLYHELFHAYMDFETSRRTAAETDPGTRRLLALAHGQQSCRYRQVLITPVVQRKSSTERRFLTERESWEALNETWAVFVGWAIWTKLELQRDRERAKEVGGDLAARWLERLGHADQHGLLVGFYEPEDPQERALTNKHYLAPSHRITPTEVALLLEVMLEETAESARRSAFALSRGGPPGDSLSSCEEAARPGQAFRGQGPPPPDPVSPNLPLDIR